jgi:hypothetical protein
VEGLLYLLAAIGVAALAVLLWRVFRHARVAPVPSGIAPDDDPEFLRQLAERTKKARTDGDADDGPAKGP